MRTDAAREAELAAMLFGALNGSADFRGRFLNRVSAHRADVLDGIRIRVEYTPPGETRRFDIYLVREDPRLEMAIELKRSETGLEEQQLREYLSLLRVLHPDGSLRRRPNAPRHSKLAVITGATEVPEVIQKLQTANNGFLSDYLSWCSWYELADLLSQRAGSGDNPSTTILLELLKDQGYVSQRSTMPRLRGQEKVFSRLSEVTLTDSDQDEMDVLQATLGRMEYEMAMLDYGVTVHVSVGKRNKKSVTRQRLVKVGRPMNVLGTQIRGRGRVFLPNDAIRRFHDESRRTRKQNEGVGLAYSIHKRSWVAYIKPLKAQSFPDGFIESLCTGERVQLDRAVEGLDGWYLLGSQKQPRKAAAFLDRAWKEYLSAVTGME
jgi:hypothetical protein